MPECTRRGCGKKYESGSEEACVFHEGAPVFHEGLKSWSCCQDVYKPVLDFDDFMKIPGCTKAERHTTAALQVEPPKEALSSPNIAVSQTEDGKEVYTSGTPTKPTPSPSTATVAASTPAPAPEPVIEQEDDTSVPVQPGATCQRMGCRHTFVSDEISRGSEAECKYHPMPPMFREGSKGYLCCKRRVLEFDEFMKIEGCKTSKHLFIPKITGAPKEELTTCRIDHYQTVDKVHVSVFAKQVDKERSVVVLKDEGISLDLYLPGSKRFIKELVLFGPIDSASSSFQYFGTKVELTLQKQDGRSWTVLEKTDKDLGNIALTFGVGGRTGTIGAKDYIVDPANKPKST